MELTALAEFFGIDIVALTSTAAIIMLVVGFLKRFIPKISGNVTQLISLGLCGLAAYATYPDEPIITMAVSAILMFAETVGGYELLKKAGGH